jgi:hypothetical protein
MIMAQNGAQETQAGGALKRRRWLLGLEPIFEGGWLHKGPRARAWDVEAELVAVAVFGDVTVDLGHAKSIPSRVEVKAYAILRDVDVYVGKGTHVELTGRANSDHLSSEVPAVAQTQRDRVVRVHGHTFLGDVTVRLMQ